MTLKDFINSKVLEFPSQQTQATYLETIQKRFADYLSSIDAVEQTAATMLIKQNRVVIKTLCEQIEYSTQEYLNGNIYNSYDAFRKGMQAVDPFLKRLYSKDQKIETHKEDKFKCLERLYRLRKHETILSDKNEMFHIPFEKRDLVNTQRYSIPGIPCLYFGSSTFIAWKELGDPMINTVYASRFQVAAGQTIKVLNLSYNHKMIRNLFLAPRAGNKSAVDRIINSSAPKTGSLIPFVEAWFVMFPLMLAASIRRKSSGTGFCDAYIIPQQIMQFIKNDKEHTIDGVRYYSTKFNNEIKSFNVPICWAFPIKQSNAKGHCAHLKELFELTDIQAWQFIDPQGAGQGTGIDDGQLQFMPNQSKPYNNTIWGISESQLGIMRANKI